MVSLNWKICIKTLKHQKYLDDYAIAGANANLAYTLELTGGGQNGFDYPEAQIEALVKETFHGFEAFGVYIAEAYN